MYIFLILVLTLVLAIIIPIKIKIDYEFYSKDYDVNDEDVKKEIKIYIFRFLKVKTIKKIKKEENKLSNNSKNNKILYNFISMLKKYIEIYRNEKSIGNNDLNKLKENIKFKSLYLEIGCNTQNMILNSYIIAYLNYLINSYIAKNADRFDLNKTKYETYISENLLKIKIKSIVNLNLANTICIIFKLIIKYMKGGNKNGKKASNRKFNDDSYDFA